MALKEMIVSDQSDPFPYEFYAREGDNDTPVRVKLVMPFGGKETGLYRYPKKGERVLVTSDGNDASTPHYLMGYLPSTIETESNFLTSNEAKDPNGYNKEQAALKEEEAMILRYQQTGKAEPSEEPADRYSEIGFYRRQTQWPSNDSVYRDVLEKGEKTRPRIDQLNIQSTGDLYTTAQNHQMLKAKRFELLVNAETEGLPLGDNKGDDSILHGGDAHIRAKNRVVIKAEAEILLQVGKTVVKISDDGFEVISKIINSNIVNDYDAKLSLSGKEGVSLKGLSVETKTINDFSISDAFGGGIGSKLGIVSIGGREIKAEVYDAAQFKTLVITALQQYALSVKNGVQGILSAKSGKEDKSEDENFVKKVVNWVSDNDIAEYVKKSIEILKKSYKLINKITGLRKEYKDYAEKAALAAAKTADGERDRAKAEAEQERVAAKRQADLDEAAGKITKTEADKRKAAADEKADKKITDAEAKAEKTKIEANAVAEKQAERKKAEESKKAMDEHAENTKKQADKEAEDAKKRADEELKLGTKTPDQVKEAKKQADKDAENTKKQADKEVENAKKQVDKDLDAREKKVDSDAKGKKDKVDEDAAKKKPSGGGSGSTP